MVVGCEAHCTRTYVSWEKGSVENCSRPVRRRHPKRTDFGKCTRAEMRQLEDINYSIHRRIHDGKTARGYDTAYAKVA